MANWPIFVNSPEMRQLIQENYLEREIKDVLFPKQLFRGEVGPEDAEKWDGEIGDSKWMSGAGIITPTTNKLQPGSDPTVRNAPYEQWQVVLGHYGGTTDLHVTSDHISVRNGLLQKAKEQALHAAYSVDRIARNRLYNAALSGWTTCRGGQGPVTALAVTRLNGFTLARNPTLANSTNPVRFGAVSGNNPLSVTILTTTGEVTRTVTGFTPDNQDDVWGPGTLTLSGGAVTVADRAYVFATDATWMHRVGGAMNDDGIASNNTLSLAAIRAMVGRFEQTYVSRFPEGFYHAHLDAVMKSQLFSDSEFRQVHQSVPDHFTYRQFVADAALGCLFLDNPECPQDVNVLNADGTVASSFATQTYATGDNPFAGEVYNAGSVRIHRALFVGAGGFKEYFLDRSGLITEAGLNGKSMTGARVVNNDVDVVAQRTQMHIRSPVNRTQDMVAISWVWDGDFAVRTDAAGGADRRRYKRVGVVACGADT